MSDGIGVAERFWVWTGSRCWRWSRGLHELVITIESVTQLVGRERCGVRAEAHDQMPIDICDLTGCLHV